MKVESSIRIIRIYVDISIYVYILYIYIYLYYIYFYFQICSNSHIYVSAFFWCINRSSDTYLFISQSQKPPRTSNQSILQLMSELRSCISTQFATDWFESTLFNGSAERRVKLVPVSGGFSGWIRGVFGWCSPFKNLGLDDWMLISVVFGRDEQCNFGGIKQFPKQNGELRFLFSLCVACFFQTNFFHLSTGKNLDFFGKMGEVAAFFIFSPKI